VQAEALDAPGWVATSPTDVRTGPLPDGPPGDVRDAPSEAWLRVARDLPPDRMAVLRRIVTGVPAGYAQVLRDGQPVAVGRGVVQGDWLYLAALAVRPDARRQGLARQVMGALGHWGRERGATRLHLHVEQSNSAAQSLYADLRTMHTYAYWRRG
jgi:N-acetylglutamate synthase